MQADDTYIDGICDHEHERTQRQQELEIPSLNEQNLAEARRGLFARIPLAENSQGSAITVLRAVMESLSAASARGDTNATAELDLLEQHHQRQRDLAASKRGYAGSPVRALEEKHKPLADIGRIMSAWIYAQMAPCVLRAFGKDNGSITALPGLVPYYIDKALVDQILRLERRRARKEKGPGDYTVGYRRPPVSTRFTSDQNPRRKAKPDDAWTQLERSRNKPVVVTLANGRKVTATRRAVAFDQLFREAIRGKRRARAETRKIIIRLDQKGMLSPPDPARRSKRNPKAPNTAQQILLKAIEMKLAPAIKRDMIIHFTRQFGPAPDFITAYEQRLSAVRETKQWSSLEAWIAELVAARATALEKAKPGWSVPVVETTSGIPSRPRTRVSPPSRTDGAARVSRTSLPSASPKQPRARISNVTAQKPARSKANDPSKGPQS